MQGSNHYHCQSAFPDSVALPLDRKLGVNAMIIQSGPTYSVTGQLLKQLSSILRFCRQRDALVKWDIVSKYQGLGSLTI